MDRGSIEISTYEAPHAPGASVSSDHREPSRGELLDVARPEADSPSAAKTQLVPTRGKSISGNPVRSTTDRLIASSRAEDEAALRATRSGMYAFSGRDSRRRLTIGAAGAFLSLALHAVIVTSLLWSSGSPPSRPRDTGAVDAVAPKAANDGALHVFLIQDPSRGPAADFASARTIANPAPPIVAIASLDALANMAMSLPDVPVEHAETVSIPSPDAGLRSALYGRYIGQIDARIERAWRRPRTAIGAPRFTCRVRIDQDSRGTVLEVTLEQCNGGERWQQSLVSAIESASPLPAPPDPQVFTRILHLSFRSQPYSPSAPRDAYEPLSAAAQPTGTGLGDDPNEQALKALGRALRDPKPNRVISLTLIGHPTDRSPAADLSTPVSAAPDPSLPRTRPPAE